ncbi:MAG: hypothetical protein LKK36_09310 [Ewingella americana]|jgi:hypothetical protein|uniref:HGGxSTG domain-containing protein n=1 Tax=Ewingella americana TaxID=41202 RepID=UPI0024317CF6|nr:HGGxSTG domain-containing protein [Ewingella americana]MCI1680462.1 hypothetical protein [Ewingella americana]MCI1856312.1 hypothetical protein [Ewingella americana]MCI1863971.1 hypothetical protein [Ewingella americana]MCI2142991.1 hypothetical protein [Ewingella americana]MCI2163876.1 hypothetical protein [Ewingella americana]
MDRQQRLKIRQAYYLSVLDASNQWAAYGYRHDQRPPHRPLPDCVVDMRCEATTRAGTSCKRKDIYSNGRCKYHGGMSTGAKTPEGKSRQLEGYRRWQERRKQATSAG